MEKLYKFFVQLVNRDNLEEFKRNSQIFYYTALKHISFVSLMDTGHLVGYKGFSLISLGDKPLLGNGYARVFLLHMYMQSAWHIRLSRY